MMPLVKRSVSAASTTARAGTDLRAARERLGRSLPDIAADLRIRPVYLEALEQGRIAALPGNTHALAFVRAYASALGLDAEETVRHFKTATDFNHTTQREFPAPRPERGSPTGVPTGAIMLLGLVLAVGIYAGWYRLSGEARPPGETIMPIPRPLPLAEHAEPSPPVAAVAVTPPDPVMPEIHADPASPNTAIAPTAAAAQPPSRPTNLPPVNSLSPSPPAASRIVLRANAESWLMVKDRTGAVLLNRILKAGEIWPVPPRPNLLLTTGNAGGTDVVLDGATTPSLGRNGTVRHDLPLDVDQIQAGKVAAGVPATQAASRLHQ